MLPFLRKKTGPKIAPEMETKTINKDANDYLIEHIMDELMDACATKNIGKFRSAIEALVLSVFEENHEQQ